jgi:cobyrinic acid a,c-diamide synthase
VYAEGGGMAYLCHEVVLDDGERWPMCGALRATARLDPQATAPRPTRLTIANDNWLAPAETQWLGYLNRRWSLEPSGGVRACVQDAGHECDVVQAHQAVGSRLHVNLAARDELLDRFFEPHMAKPCEKSPK